MTLEAFSRDAEFRKLISRRSDVNLTVAALELARDVYPTLDFSSVFCWIDERADELSGPLAGARNEQEAIAELGRCIAGKHGVSGGRDSYDSADGSFLHRVIERKTGIPISLSVLYMAVAERAGWSLQGVSAPGHFLMRYEAVDGPFLVDAFAGGQILTVEQCMERIQIATQLPFEQALSALEPVGPRSIIIRMLNNLKILHCKQLNWQAAWVVQHRLLALQPASYSERRDLAMIALKASHPGEALDLLEACLKQCPKDETEVLEQQVSDARKQLVAWN